MDLKRTAESVSKYYNKLPKTSQHHLPRKRRKTTYLRETEKGFQPQNMTPTFLDGYWPCVDEHFCAKIQFLASKSVVVPNFTAFVIGHSCRDQ